MSLVMPTPSSRPRSAPIATTTHRRRSTVSSSAIDIWPFSPSCPGLRHPGDSPVILPSLLRTCVQEVEQGRGSVALDLAHKERAGVEHAIEVPLVEHPGVAEAVIGEVDVSAVVIDEPEAARAHQDALEERLVGRQARPPPLHDVWAVLRDGEHVLHGTSADREPGGAAVARDSFGEPTSVAPDPEAAV